MTKKPEAENGVAELVQQALVPTEERPYQVPANWLWVKLQCIAEVKGGKRLPAGHHLVEHITKYPYVRVTDFSDGTVDVGGLQYIEHNTYEKIQHYTIARTDIYISIAGTIGKVGIIPEIIDGANLTENAAKISDIKIDQRFLFQVLSSEELQKQIRASTKATTQAKLALYKIADLIIPVPPLPEQQRIVNVIESLFAKLDRARELLEELQDAFEEQKATILARAFRGELTARWREERGLDTQACFQKVSNVCAVNPEKMKTTGLQDDLDVSFIPMAAVSEISGTIVSPEIQKFGKVKKGYTNFKEGDVLFAKITPCMENGKVVIAENLINGFGYGTTEFFVLRPGDKLNNRYLYHLLRSIWFRNEAKGVMAGAVGQQRVPKAFIEEYEFFCPSIQEQQEIVRILDDLLDKTSAAASLCDQIDQIDQLKKTILAKAFRGELDTNDPAEESAEKLLREVLRQRAAMGASKSKAKRMPLDAGQS